MDVKKGERQLFYKQFGKGETLCLLHGFLENHLMWGPMLDELVKQYHILVIDLPGHGHSVLPDEQMALSDMAFAVNEVLESLELNEVKFVGHSMGGYVALAFAEAYPQKTKGILLLNSTPEADSAERKEMRNHAVDMAGRNYEALISMSVTNLFSSKKRAALEQEIVQTKAEALKVSAEAYVACQKAMSKRPDYSEFWERASFKKSMILGSDDGLIDPGKMQQKFSSHAVKIDVLTGGHMLHIENFTEVVSLLVGF